MTSNLPQREAVARIKSMAARLADPRGGSNLLSVQDATQHADDLDQIISSLQDRWRPIDPAVLEEALLTKAADYDTQAMDHPGTSRARAYCMAKAAGLREAVSISRNLPLPPIPSSLKGSDVGEVGE